MMPTTVAGTIKSIE
jgi:glycine C-acetyltransferase